MVSQDILFKSVRKELDVLLAVKQKDLETQLIADFESSLLALHGAVNIVNLERIIIERLPKTSPIHLTELEERVTYMLDKLSPYYSCKRSVEVLSIERHATYTHSQYSLGNYISDFNNIMYNYLRRLLLAPIKRPLTDKQIMDASIDSSKTDSSITSSTIQITITPPGSHLSLPRVT